MGFLSKLLGMSSSAPKVRHTIHEVQAQVIYGLLVPQLQLLDLGLEAVPSEGSFVSKRSRGYIYGLAAGILGVTMEHQTAEAAEDVMQVTFTLVWGKTTAQDIFEQTLAECAARDSATLAGSYRAEADVGEVYAGKPYATVMGFWLLNNGMNDPEEIMPAITTPR